MDGGPCVVYMHGNASSQWEGQFLIPNLCPRGIAVFCFDFAGCGASDGEFISLGHFETMDVEFLLQSLLETFRLGPFVLWGRSMGAATSLLVRHPAVVGIVVDSAYTSIPDAV
jgi:pimeloyl-ACP methyl ester carboxylesterase